MVKTQVQIPDQLFKEAKRVAKEYEMSFAEVVRRGLERVIISYPKRANSDSSWSLPILNATLITPLESIHTISADSESDRSLEHR